jgi:hypothetical protein
VSVGQWVKPYLFAGCSATDDGAASINIPGSASIARPAHGTLPLCQRVD